MLPFILYITSSFPTPDSFVVLCNTIVRPKQEAASVLRNSIASVESSELEVTQRKCSALCYSRFQWCV